MDKRYASVGWGIFYQLVNIGGFLGPMIAGYLRILEWEYVFVLCAVGVALNFIPLLMFKEPKHESAVSDLGPGKIMFQAFAGLLNPRVFFFSLAFAGFWLMFYQLFDILPNFIDDWIDTRAIASFTLGIRKVLQKTKTTATQVHTTKIDQHCNSPAAFHPHSQPPPWAPASRQPPPS